MATGLVKTETEVQINAEALIKQGIDKGLSTETMEKLLAMRKQLKDEWAREQFYISLAKFQSETPAIKKEKQVKDKDGKVRYSYAPLEVIVEQVKGGLENSGFSYTLKTKQADTSLTVICEAHHRDGHTESTEVTVPVKADYMSAQQVVGSAITYAKRYAFCNAFGIMTGDEDNDGISGEAVDTTLEAEKKKADAGLKEQARQEKFEAEHVLDSTVDGKKYWDGYDKEKHISPAYPNHTHKKVNGFWLFYKKVEAPF